MCVCVCVCVYMYDFFVLFNNFLLKQHSLQKCIDSASTVMNNIVYRFMLGFNTVYHGEGLLTDLVSANSERITVEITKLHIYIYPP